MNFKELVESVLISEVALSSANKIRFMKQFNTDSIKALEYLERFNSAVLKLTNKDIFSYKSLEELDKALEGIKVVKTKREAKREASIKGSKVVYEDNDYVLRLIRSKDAAIAYGKGARWCISYDDSKKREDEPRAGNMFWRYALDDDYTIYIATAKRLPSDNEELKKIAILVNDRGYCEMWTAENTIEYEGSQTNPIPSILILSHLSRIESVYPNVREIFKYVPYTDEELGLYIDEHAAVGLAYAFRTGIRVPKVEELLLAGCYPTERIGDNIIRYARDVVRERWPEYEAKILVSLKHIIDRKTYYAQIFEYYNNDQPFIEYIELLQSIGEEWPEFEKLLESFSGDIRFKRLYYTYKNMVAGRTLDSQESSSYYEDRGI